MDVSQLRTRVRSLTAISSTSVLPDTEIDDYLEEASLFLANLADWPQLRVKEDVAWVAGNATTSVTFTAPVSTAQRIIDVYAINPDNGQAWSLYERVVPVSATTGEAFPREWLWDAAAASLSLFPTPDRDLTITMTLVADPWPLADGIWLSDRYAPAIAFLAAAYILEREGDSSGRSNTYKQRAFETIDNARRALLTPARRTVTLGGRRTRGRGLRRGVG